MAKIVKKDAGKRYQEDVKRSSEEIIQHKREVYRDSLRNTDEFQEYVVKEWEKEISKLSDVRNFPSGSVEELAKLTFHTKLALNVIEKFIGPFRR